jgi:hypothetical protein
MLVTLVTSASVFGAETVTLAPVADTTLIEAAPDNNLGAHAYFNAGTTGPNASLLRNRALIRFDPVAAIPPQSKVVSAQLTLEVVGEPTEGSVASTFELRRILRPWGEGNKSPSTSPGLGLPATPGEATWRHRLASTTNLWDQPGGAVGTDFSSLSSSAQIIYDPDQSPYEFPTTTLLVADVQAWLDEPVSNQGWMLLTTAESTPKTARRFGSRESQLDAPRLRIEFIPPPRIDRASVVGGNLELEFSALAGQAYQVETRVDLGAPSAWLSFTNIPAPAAATQVVVADPLTGPHRYYRVRAEVP